MSRLFQNASAANEPGINRYLVMGLISLAVIGVVTLERTNPIFALIPVLTGLAGALSTFGPILLIVAVAVCLNASAYSMSGTTQPGAMDLLLGCAVVAYAISHYRVQSLIGHVFPVDPNNKSEPKPRRGVFKILPPRRRMKLERRSAELVTSTEIAGVLWSIPVFVILAQYIWLALPNESPHLYVPQPIWRAMVLTWMIGLACFVAFGILGYLRARQMTHAEATILLQDALWAETRREQRRLNRWLAWQHRRNDRKGKT
jgi:hypothetical protein